MHPLLKKILDPPLETFRDPPFPGPLTDLHARPENGRPCALCVGLAERTSVVVEHVRILTSQVVPF